MKLNHLYYTTGYHYIIKYFLRIWDNTIAVIFTNSNTEGSFTMAYTDSFLSP